MEIDVFNGGHDVMLDGEPFADVMRKLLSVSMASMDKEFEEHSRKFLDLSMLYDAAVSRESELKQELARTYAKIDYAARLEAADAGLRKTEKMVENEVITHDLYREVQKEYNEAKLRSSLLKSARDAMIHKRDMLVQLGAARRSESYIANKEDEVRNIING